MVRFGFKEADFTAPELPKILQKAQWVARRWRGADTAAMARWGLVAGITLFWFVEPYDFIKQQLGWEEKPENNKAFCTKQNQAAYWQRLELYPAARHLILI
eukprot:jgi/Galph1/5434/GphlegSOOS_G4085.1